MKTLALASILLLYPLTSPPSSEQRVANFGHGEAGAADYEHLSFWVRDGRRAEMFYSYGSNWRAQNIRLTHLGAASCDGEPCFKVRFKNGAVFRIVPSDDSLRMIGERGYDKQFRWSGGGEGGAVCDICAENGGEAVKLLRGYFLK